MKTYRTTITFLVTVLAAFDLAGCAGGSSGTGTAGTSGGGTSGAAGTGAAGTGAAGTGAAGTGTAGAGAAGTVGTTGTGGTAGTTGIAGTSGAAGTNGAGGGGTTGTAGHGGTTGTAGNGGTAGVAGRGGATGAAGTGGSAAAVCPAGAIFCADFESGSIPSQAVYFPAYQQTMISMFMAVDATVGYGGSTHSLKVTPGGNFSQMLGVTTGTATFWTRVHLRSDVDTVTVSGHDTFVLATDGSGDPNAGEAVRVGEHSCQLELNRKSDDKEILSDAVNGTSNYQCAGGIAFVKNTWYCLEVYYNGPGHEVRVFVDGAESTALHVTDWGPYTYAMFKFGFENYGGTARNIWYDDVAVATQRIGCN